MALIDLWLIWRWITSGIPSNDDMERLEEKIDKIHKLLKESGSK